MNLVTFEDEINAELLAQLTAKVTVESFPDNFEEYVSQLKNRNGAVLTVWQGGAFDPSDGNNEQQLVQDVTYTWEFTVLQKSLKLRDKHHGIYEIIEDIRTILSGFTPASFPDSSVLEPVNSGYVSRVHGFYVYQITFSHTIKESES